MITKDLLHNSTTEILIVSEALGVAVETGATVDLLGVGRKVLVNINAGVPAAGGLVDVVIHESDDNFAADDDVLYTFTQKSVAGLYQADLAPNKRYIRAVATVTVAAFTVGIEGIVYLEREIPSGI